ncbi:MAG: diacylglycerol/polyprenol kinase family protein [Desulfovibrionales bacterium]
MKPLVDHTIPLSRSCDLHPLRKAWHAGSGLALFWVAFYSGLDRGTVLLLLGVFFTADLSLELARLSFPGLNRLVLRVFGPIMRDREAHTLSGTPFYLAGFLTAILVFPRPVAQLALLYLILGDPAASIAGILSKSRGPRLAAEKTLIGTGTAALVCFAVTLFMLPLLVLPGELTWTNRALLALAGGMAGGMAELFPVKIDDNFIIPVVSGLLLWPFFILLT